MMHQLIVVLSLLILVSQDSAGTYKTWIFVSSNGHDSPSCGSSLQPCKTLDHAYDVTRTIGFNSTFIALSKGSYELRTSLIFERVEYFGLGARNEDVMSNEVEITCDANVSIAFFLSRNITLRSFKLYKCGGWHDSFVTSPNFMYKFRTAVHFVYCRNVRLSKINFLASTGQAANFYEAGGILNVTDCIFENSSTAIEERPSTGSLNQSEAGSRIIKYVWNSGGGAFLMLNKYGEYNPGKVASLVTPAEHDTYIHRNTYVFKNCSFLRNEVRNIQREFFFPDDFPETFNLPFSHGGGLSIFFGGNANGSSILVEDCTFQGNRAPWGGGLQVEFASLSQNNILSIERTLFDSNVGYSSGGGARVGNMLTKGIATPMNRFYFVNCSFSNNSASWGGGVSVYGTSIFCNCRHSFTSGHMFTFRACRWLENIANTGSAIGAYLYNQNDDYIGPEVPFHLVLNHCLLQHNTVVLKERNVRVGEGAVYSVEVPVVLQRGTSILNNTYTALVLDSATLEVYDEVAFTSNRGFRGGAIALYGQSKIVLTKKSRLLFKRNTCNEKGGALYIHSSGPPQVSLKATGKNSPHTCFFAYEDPRVHFNDWDARVLFEDNQAPDGASGHSVYATTLQNCRTAGEIRVNNSVLAWKFVQYSTSMIGRKRTAVRQSVRREIGTDPVDMKYNLEEWKVAPNELFNATVQLLDEKGNLVYGIVKVVVSSEERGSSPLVNLITPSPLFLANGSISSVLLQGKVGGSFSVTLQHVGQEVLRRSISNISLKSCHPGFYSKGQSCVCSASPQVEGISRCNDDGKTFFLKRGFWGGMVSGRFAISPCPPTFCNCPRNKLGSLLVDGECAYIPREMCNGNRDPGSILCGKCKPGYSVVLGDSSCYKCSKHGYLILIPLLLLFLVGLVMLVMLLNLDAFTGSLNASLYSYQVMSQLLGERFELPDHFMRFVINVFNFRLTIGARVCVSSNMDDGDKLFIELLIPSLTMLLVILLVKVVGRYPNWCFSRRVKAPFHAICTISVLCYTSVTMMCLSILSPTTVGDKTVLFASGNTEFFRGKHIVYGILAVFLLIFFVLLFPLILMFRPFLTRFLRPVFNLNHLKPMLDVLQNCFKDQYRWFAAFYFVCRLLILIIATYIPPGPVKRSFLEVTCNGILFVFAYLRPYKQSKFNTQDALLLFNLSIITVFSSATVSDSIVPANRSGLTVLVSILAYAPLLVLAFNAFRNAWKYCQGRRFCRAEEDPPDEPVPSETTAWVSPM